MQVIWSLQARSQLDALVRYIARDDIDAALHMDDLICNAAEGLCQFPLKGKIGRVEGTRELVVHPNYILVYAIDGRTINIASVLHAAQQYPPE